MAVRTGSSTFRTGIGVSDIFTGPTLITLPASDVNYHFCEGVLMLSMYVFKGEKMFLSAALLYKYNEAFNKVNWQASVGVLILIP